MPIYLYKAITSSGETLEGEIDADSKTAVVETLQRAGHFPVSTLEKPARGRYFPGHLRGRFHRNRIHPKDIMLFTRELATLLQAGLPLDHSLQTLQQLNIKPALRERVADINARVKGGESLSAAMNAWKGDFSTLYRNMVRAGEASGALHVVLERLAGYLERTHALRTDVISALLYPGILFFVAMLSIFIMLLFVVPEFIPLFDDAGQTLPPLTQFVFSGAEMVRKYWWVALGAMTLSIWLFEQQLRNPTVRAHWDKWKLNIPVYGDLLIKLEVARFTRTLGTLLSNGVPLLTATEIVKDVMNNRVLVNVVAAAAKGLEGGQHFAAALTQSRYFPVLATQLIHVGEKTGQLEAMLLKVADIYEQESRTAIKRFLTLMEPVLILGLGVIIAIIITAILVAILGLNELVA